MFVGEFLSSPLHVGIDICIISLHYGDEVLHVVGKS